MTRRVTESHGDGDNDGDGDDGYNKELNKTIPRERQQACEYETPGVIFLLLPVQSSHKINKSYQQLKIQKYNRDKT